MEGKTIFPREEKSEILFEKILRDPWACEKLMDTFCNYLFCNDDFDCNLSPEEFTKSLLSAYLDRDMSAFLMSICNNTMFDLLRNSYLIPYRFNADGKCQQRQRPPNATLIGVKGNDWMRQIYRRLLRIR